MNIKKLISAALAGVVLAGSMVFSSGAAGSLVFSDNFDNGFAARNWCTDSNSCAFKWDGDNGCIHGYRDAVVLQSNYDAKYNRCWATGYFNMDVQIRGFDNLPDENVTSHGISFWFKDFVSADGIEYEITYWYNIEVETGDAKLSKEGEFKYKDEYGITQTGKVNSVIATGNIGDTIEVGENAEWFKMGLRVESGKIAGYYNEQLIVSSVASDSTQKIGPVSVDAVDATLGTNPSMFLVWNHGGNWLALDNFEVWTPDYDFIPEIPYGDVNGDEKINMMDATKLLQFIAGWQVKDFVEAPADVNGDGKVNLSDVTRLLQHIAGWDVVLGPATE